jgi:hypothetical protein
MGRSKDNCVKRLLNRVGRNCKKLRKLIKVLYTMYFHVMLKVLEIITAKLTMTPEFLSYACISCIL